MIVPSVFILVDFPFLQKTTLHFDSKEFFMKTLERITTSFDPWEAYLDMKFIPFILYNKFDLIIE